MILNFIIYFTFYFNLSNAIVYDSYYGVPVSEERMQEFVAAGSVHTCTNNIKPCDEAEGSRIDGSCNNLKHPSHGAAHTPQLRFVDAAYDENFEPRTSVSGKPLMIPRKLRTTILKVGKAISQTFTQFIAYYTEFIINDILSVQDTTNYLLITTHCCEESGKTDYMCTPNKIPKDDPVHRFSGYRCMNQTRPFSFQNQGCVAKNTTPDRMDYSTVAWDLNNLYNYDINEPVIPKIRTYEGGLLKTETVNGREFTSDGNSSCTIQQALDTGCTRNVPNGLIGTNIFSNLYWRQHNSVARKLAELNPNWDDHKLFYTSRDINIAINVRIMYEELWPLLLGREAMIENGIISANNTGYSDLYNKNVPLKIFLEYAMVNRWFHTIQEGIQHKISPNGTYLGDTAIVDFTLKVEKLAIDDNMMTILNGAYRQPGGDHDFTVDPEIADRGVGSSLQATLDLCTQDINKGRYFGTAPYIEYRDKCMNYTIKHKTFQDLEYIIPRKNLELLQTVYEYPEDIELMTGVMLEKHIKGGHVPATAACIIMEQLKQSIITDRHWYERPNRPNAFTIEQLHEIKKSTLARLICDTGDNITHIQSKAFQRIGPDNEMVPCEEIPKIDLSAWQENTWE